MAKVINSNNTNFIGKDLVYSARKYNIEIGGLLGWGGTKFNLADLTNLKILEDETHLGQSGTGKIAGGAVGGLLMGGAGAIVGSMASGNNKKITTKKIAFEFGSTWFIAEFETSFVDSVVMKSILSDCKIEQSFNPFAKENA